MHILVYVHKKHGPLKNETIVINTQVDFHTKKASQWPSHSLRLGLRVAREQRLPLAVRAGRGRRFNRLLDLGAQDTRRGDKHSVDEQDSGDDPGEDPLQSKELDRHLTDGEAFEWSVLRF